MKKIKHKGFLIALVSALIISSSFIAVSYTHLLGSIYGVWLIYASGINYMLIAIVIYALGIPVFVKARRETSPNEKEFTKVERYFAIVLIILALIGLV